MDASLLRINGESELSLIKKIPVLHGCVLKMKMGITCFGELERCNLTYLAGPQDPAVIIEETKVGY